MSTRDPLPIDTRLAEITHTVRERRALVLIAEPGAGKTTRVPPALVPAEMTSAHQVVVLEPRRLAARAAANRIAQENGWSVGREVGYQVRHENRTSDATRVHVITEGIFIRRLQSDPFLSKVRTVILDEFHERSIASDLALALTEEIRQSARPDLEVVVMSATMDPEPVARFLHRAPTLVVEGRTHPVEIAHVEPRSRSVEDSVVAALADTWEAASGHTLVFLPGVGEIARTEKALGPFARQSGAQLLRLHGTLPLEEQERVLAPSKSRKIILATNVAETSLTVPGVDLVIDSGFARQRVTDPRHGIDRLEVVPISQHSAAQRAGRAGRLGPGRAVRLWSASHHRTRRLADRAEVARVDLAEIVLELKAWGVGDVRRFEWFETPSDEALESAERLLTGLGACDPGRGALTPIGRDLLALGVHPRLGRILLAAGQAGYPQEGATLAALLEERDIVLRERAAEHGAATSGPSDLLLRLELFEHAAADRFHPELLDALGLHGARTRAVERLRRDLLRRATAALPSAERAAGPRPPSRETALLQALLEGFPDRVARRRAAQSDRGRLVGGRGVTLARESVVRDDEFFVALDVEETARDGKAAALVRLASAVERRWLEELHTDAIHEAIETTFDEITGKVRSTATRKYHDLPLEEPRALRPDPEAAALALAEAARPRARAIVTSHEAARLWLARVGFVSEHVPELKLPLADAEALAELVAGQCAGKTTLEELDKVDWLAVLQGFLPYEMRSAVERHAPASLRIPSGREVTLQYEKDHPPVLAARVQELFGLAETPRVAGGKVPVLLHILAPNYRPVQVTQDVRSFWDTTYAQVRKDLRGRYPKHAWPEDPWSAKASEARRRKRRGE